MKKSLAFPLCLFLLSLSACVSQYKLPGDNEPAALVKARMTIDVDLARKFIPGDRISEGIAISVSVRDGNKNYIVLSKSVPGLLSSRGNQTETQSLRLHPNRPVILNIDMGAVWQTSKMELVHKTEQVPKQVTKYVQEYDSYRKQSVSKMKTVTEYETVRKTVNEMVTKNFALSCTASMGFIPEKDAVYLADYSNLMVDKGCSIQVYQQLPEKDGKFKLVPVKEYKTPAGDSK